MKAPIKPSVFAGLFRHEASSAVFVPAEGRVGLRTVPVGSRNFPLAVLEGGVEAGERAIVHPSDAVRVGGRVRAREPGGS